MIHVSTDRRAESAILTGSRSVTIERVCVHAQPDYHTAVNEAEPNRRVQYCTVHQEGRVRRPPILSAIRVRFWTAGRRAVGYHDHLTKCRDGGRLVFSQQKNVTDDTTTTYKAGLTLRLFRLNLHFDGGRRRRIEAR